MYTKEDAINQLSEDAMRVSDIPSKYPRRWVIVEVTRRDNYGLAEKGRVILESDEMQDALSQARHHEGDLYIFYTGSIDNHKG